MTDIAYLPMKTKPYQTGGFAEVTHLPTKTVGNVVAGLEGAVRHSRAGGNLAAAHGQVVRHSRAGGNPVPSL